MPSRYKEYRLSRDMDRLPVTGESKAHQDREVEKDTRLLNAFKHGEGCGCAVCKGFARNLRAALRPDGEQSAEPKRIAPPPKPTKGI